MSHSAWEGCPELMERSQRQVAHFELEEGGSHDPNPNANLTGAPQVSILPSLDSSVSLVLSSKQDFAEKPMQSS